MAFTRSVVRAQHQIGCQICETGSKIQWKCLDCSFLICDRCEQKVHPKFGKGHQVVNLKDLGRKASESDGKGTNIIEFTVMKKYAIDTNDIHYIVMPSDNTLWIGDNISMKIQHVKISDDKVTVMSSIRSEIYGLAISPTGSIFAVISGSSLKMINEKAGKTEESTISLHPWELTCVHVTSDKKIILGGQKGGRGVVIVMNLDGKRLKKYENDNDKQMFKYPERIITTKNSSIFITDWRDHRVVVIRPGGGDVRYFKGHPKINSENKHFVTKDVTVTPQDNVLILDCNTDYLHILNNVGDFIGDVNLSKIEVIRPFSLALSPSGNIFIGCLGDGKYRMEAQATLYELQYIGV